MQTFNTLKEMFADRSRWTQGTTARDINGAPIDPSHSEHVASYCLLGGLMCIYPDPEQLGVRLKLMKVIDEQPDGRESATISSYNDTHSYEDVMAIVEKAGV